MAESILQSEKECFFCRATSDLEYHHIYFGTANRKVSEKHGFKVWLCNRHHTSGEDSVHRSRVMDLVLKKVCQYVYERDHTRAEFMKLIGRSYV